MVPTAAVDDEEDDLCEKDDSEEKLWVFFLPCPPSMLAKGIGALAAEAAAAVEAGGRLSPPSPFLCRSFSNDKEEERLRPPLRLSKST
mmetsp:Transcript_64025/g.128696  ORF Transcript_64025/g.128696 Transcript_64025/m.128696 type:complete len:88 (-) Transcript_64025:460-723(-)